MEIETPESVIESCTVVRLRPGDIVLFRIPTPLRLEERARVCAMLEEVFPAHESIVLDGGQDIAVLRPEPGLFGRLLRRFRGA